MTNKTRVIVIALALSIFLLLLQFSSSQNSPTSDEGKQSDAQFTTSLKNNYKKIDNDDGFTLKLDQTSLKISSQSSTAQNRIQSPVSMLSDLDYYPNGRPDRTISIVTLDERKRANGLCTASIETTTNPSSSSSSLFAPQINLPWIVEDLIFGGFESIAQIIDKENLSQFWGYASSTSSSASKQKDCFLPFGHIRRLLSRARLTAIIKFDQSSSQSPISLNQLKQLSKLLSVYAPSWRIIIKNPKITTSSAPSEKTVESSASSSTTQNNNSDIIHLERRAKVFIFGITGGNIASSRRARYAEWTWGARSPIQWFADQWDENIRPIYKDQHPLYLKDKFNYLTFKISRVWQIVYKYYWSLSHQRIDWFIRLWDDNYFYEENLFPILYRLPHVINPQRDEVLAGKLGWRHLGPPDAIFPFAGGGAGWYLTSAGMKKFGNSIDDMEKWIPVLRAKKDIFLPHGMHDEDVFLTAWIGTLLKINCTNIPGVEHVSPGMAAKQRCLSDETLFDLRWKDDVTIFFDYTGAKSRELRVEDTWYSYTKPLIWHYMSPRRLLKLEGLLYEERKKSKGGDLPQNPEDAPSTSVDLPPRKKGKTCYPGVPPGGAPPRGFSLFEKPLPESMKDEV